MEKIIYFDYCALIIMIILLTTTYLRRMTKGQVNRCFGYILVNHFVACIADVIAISLDNMAGGHILQQYIWHSIYLFTHALTPALYMMYLVALSDTWHRYQNKLIRVLLFLPIGLCLLVLCTNGWIKKLFYINAQGEYIRGEWFLLLYLCTGIYTIMIIEHLLRYHVLFSKREFVFLAAVIPLQVIALFVQFIAPQYPVELFAMSIGLLILSLMLQGSEQLIDPATGIGNMKSYMKYVRRGIKNGKIVRVILTNVSNYFGLRDMLGYSGVQDLVAVLANEMMAICENEGIKAEYYYLGDGKLRCVAEQRFSAQCMEAAQKINRHFKDDILVNELSVNVNACVCIMDCPRDIDDIESIMVFGNDLSKLKHSEGVLFASDIYKKDHYDLMHDIDKIIENALSNHKFEVYYQPIYSVEEHRFNSAEALLRLKDETYGFVSPEIFIPAAEKSGAIHKIGNYVLEEVCQFIASEQYKQLGLDYIEINLSVAQCMKPQLADDVIQILNKYHVSVNQINLEITETAASYSQNTMMENIEKLVQAGVSFSLDDYGTGYSNMQRIASMPFHIVKLDKSFTNTYNDTKMMIVLENTIRMIKDMDMKIVVEGIETKESMKQFSALECEYIQGYYYSKPIPKQEFIEFIIEEHKRGK